MRSLNRYKLKFSNWPLIAAAVIGLNHLIGLAGLNIPATKEMFEAVSFLNLLLSAILVLSFHRPLNYRFLFYALTAMSIGFIAEVTGVQTGWPFGSYYYSLKFGFRVFGVPLIIGLNWLLLSYCCSIVASGFIQNPVLKIVAAALMMVFLDLFLEPFAIRHSFWTWTNDLPGWQNYMSWFIISIILQIVYFRIIRTPQRSYVPLSYLLVLTVFLIGDRLLSLVPELF